MLLPENFTNQISKHFFDKHFYVLNVEDIIESDGGAKRNISGTKSEFLGNIRFVKYGVINSEKGAIIEADAIITADKNTEIKPNDIIQYLIKRYLVIGVNIYDSHIEIEIKKWPSE